MKQIITNLLQKTLKEEIKLKKEEIENLIEIPPYSEMGDYAFPCFFLSKKFKQNPNKIAEELSQKIKLPKEIEKIENKGPYINFFLNKKKLAENIISKILKQGNKFGSFDIGKGKKILVEFSQPNTHKAFHIGHIRGTSIGESLSRIFEFSDNKVIRANYSGDAGMHVAKWIWCYKKYHSKEKLRNEEAWIASIYVDAVKRLLVNKELQKEVNEINLKLGNKTDKKLNELWKKTRKFSINSWKKIYKELGTHFDVHYFENNMEKPALKIVNQLLKKKIAKRSEGAVIVDLEKYNLGIWVLLRKDRTVLYSAKDLSLALKKLKDYNPDKYLVVVGDEQDFHFNQLKKTLELMKFKNAKDYNHLAFGMVRFPWGKMSSRSGENILYSDFIKELTNYAKKEIKSRYPKISKKELEKKALKISIAAINYSMLKQNSNKNIIFQKEKVLNFEGDTGLYLQYSYARASSILRKAKIKREKFKINSLEDKEFNLVKKLFEFPEIVSKAYNGLNPSIVANYSYQLAQIFNEFYHKCPVINSEKRFFRLSLVDAFRQTLKNSLYLLGVEVMEKL